LVVEGFAGEESVVVMAPREDRVLQSSLFLRLRNTSTEGFYKVLESEHELGSALPFPWTGKHRDCKLDKTLTAISKISAPIAIERMSLSQ
jgi:hypothetical protein